MRVAAAYDNGNVFHHFGMTSELLAENGIKLFGGVSGSADEAVEKLIAGTLECGRMDTGCCHHDHAYDDAEKN